MNTVPNPFDDFDQWLKQFDLFELDRELQAVREENNKILERVREENYRAALLAGVVRNQEEWRALSRAVKGE